MKKNGYTIDETKQTENKEDRGISLCSNRIML